MRRAQALLLAAVLCAGSGCAKKGDPVAGTIERVARLVEKGDADGVSGLLARDFRDAEGEGRAEAVMTLRRYLAAYESLTVRLSGLEIDRKEGVARAAFVAAVSGSPRKALGLDAVLPRSSRLRFEVNLVAEDGTWKVAWVSWSEAGPAS